MPTLASQAYPVLPPWAMCVISSLRPSGGSDAGTYNVELNVKAYSQDHSKNVFATRVLSTHSKAIALFS